MRIVLVHRYFWPDTPPYAHILREIALGLGDAGHDVIVLTCQPSYNRTVVRRAPREEQLGERVRVRRVPVLDDRRFAVLKLVNLVWFALWLVSMRRRVGPVDAVMAASTPPIAIAKVGAWFARHHDAPFVYHKQDIYPEVVTAPGIMASKRLAAALRYLDRRTEQRSARVVVLSEDMADTVVARGVGRRSVEIINNFDPWALEPADSSGHRRPRETTKSGPLRIAFAGNLGRFQNLETFFDAIDIVGPEPGIEYHFFGHGSLADHFAARVASSGLTNVHLHGYQPPGVVANFLADEAHLGVVSLMPGVIRAAYPSKTLSYLRQGCAVLALVESDSELARTIIEAGAGYQASPSDPYEIADVLRKLAADPNALAAAGQSAARLYASHFTPLRQIQRWVDLFGSLGREAS